MLISAQLIENKVLFRIIPGLLMPASLMLLTERNASSIKKFLEILRITSNGKTLDDEGNGVEKEDAAWIVRLR